MYTYILVEFLLMAIINPVDGDYKFSVYAHGRFCEVGKFTGGSGFYIRYVYGIIYDTNTRIVAAKDYDYNYEDNNLGYSMHFHYNGTMENKGFGMYVMVQRNGEDRRSENPPSNFVIRRDTTKENGAKPMPGTGNDFTSLWNGAPLMLNIQISDVKENGTSRRMRQDEPQKCAETDKWVANEGFYKLEDDGSWIPVYYDPWETDFYY
ncbi:hypothetical protein GCK32_003248 [Trichostrongylus colubriformis]|uniref:Uncharacterized protein n=1 Tax=Trichostrongylus colubriformis TaxID=6319 RepID=A0AAN8IDR7_TRICO